MIPQAVSKHMAKIGAKGGKAFKPGPETMRNLAKLSWSEQARAKRLSKPKPCQSDISRKNI